MYDLIIKGGTIVDGSGVESYTGDVAIEGDRIVALGPILEGEARRVLDAAGLLVTPGWVDIHTHYDGQVTWDPYLTPSSWHGVTTLVMGNCGVGFAPAKKDSHAWLIGLMEGVEDIPGTALAEGIRWEWESFPEYLDAVERGERAVDVGAQVAHGAVRAYVMGERGAKNEPATPEDIDRMAAIVKEAVAAGALGFSTSRTIVHRAVDGEPVPGTFAAEDELLGIGRALGELGQGVFELAPAGAAGEDLAAPDKEMAWMRKLAAETGRPVSFALVQHDMEPEQYRRMLDLSLQASAEGARVVPQVAGRPTSMLMGWQTTVNPFIENPSYKEIADLPFEQKRERLRDPAVRERMINEEFEYSELIVAFVCGSLHKLFPLGDPLDYEPEPDKSIAAIAERDGKSPKEIAYDMLMQRDGTELLYFPLFNYSYGSLDSTREMLLHPAAALGLSDGGAHCGVICDASIPTYMLTHWARDRERGERLPLEWIVKRQTHDTAELYGLLDRGVLAVGMKADVNVIDFDKLRLRRPRVAYGLPANGRRLLQEVDGYVATVVSGVVTYENGEPTGAMPGKLVRGAQPAPV
ncbi:MAG: D-aminoacylase [Myxococcales bacterium]|nr:MAG: D-aminoacylase [Myxococcales bacterium]